MDYSGYNREEKANRLVESVCSDNPKRPKCNEYVLE